MRWIAVMLLFLETYNPFVFLKSIYLASPWLGERRARVLFPLTEKQTKPGTSKIDHKFPPPPTA